MQAMKDSRHLNRSRWFDITATGTIRRKRVSAAMNEQFPLEYRKYYQSTGANAAKLTKYVMVAEALQLSDAWIKVQSMFNS